MTRGSVILSLVLMGLSRILLGNSFSVDYNFLHFPIYFVENQGQLDSRVAYYVPGKENSLYFENGGITVVLHPKSRTQNALSPVSYSSKPNAETKRWNLQLEFVGANINSNPQGQNVTQATINYFRGTKKNWRTGVKTYSSLKYSELWPGIDLIYSGSSNQVKYKFIVAPGIDPNQILLAYKGADKITISETGELEVSTTIGSFHDSAPVAFQEIEGVHRTVKVSYSLHTNDSDGKYFYGFEIGAYDKSKPLILDPAVFLSVGYIGGAGSDDAQGVAVDQYGNAYVVGQAGSDQTTFPVTVGPDLTYNGSFNDAYIAKIGPRGPIYIGYIGGSGEDGASDVVVDPNGNAYVVGNTNSATSFPVVIGPSLTYGGGQADTFVAKIDPSGTTLVYSGFIGGANTDAGIGIALDGRFNAYVTGQTDSDETTFPVKVGPDLNYNGGPFDAFVAEINYQGTDLLYCGYIGGEGEDTAGDIAVDRLGMAVISGTTNSKEFPKVNGPDFSYNGGISDAFVAKVDRYGTGLIFSGYIGGEFEDGAGSIFKFGGVALDSAGDVYVTGTTSSDENTFPVVTGPDLTFNGYTDAFVCKVERMGRSLIYCGYIGGSWSDSGADIVVDSAGNAYIAGTAGSDQSTFPVIDGPDLTYNSVWVMYDAFVARVNSSGLSLDYCGYIGGDDLDVGLGIAIDRSSNAYVVGLTDSTQGTFPVLLGPDLTYNGHRDGFIAKISKP